MSEEMIERHQGDEMIRLTLMDGQVRVMMCETTQMAQRAADIHGATPVCTAAMGRLMTATSMLGVMMKGDNESVTVNIHGDGPMGTIVAVANHGDVKVCADDARVELPLRADGKLDVGGAIGHTGRMTVIKDLGLKEPYVGQIPLVSGNIAEDITAYYTVSEQIPTVCALGIVFNEDATIKAAGGYMLQLVPPVLDSSVKVIEDNLQHMESITGMLEKGLKPEELAVSALEGLGGEILDQWEAVYYCDCSRERTEQILISLGKKELQKLVDEGEETEVCCHFCNKKYKFSTAEISNLLKEQK